MLALAVGTIGPYAFFAHIGVISAGFAGFVFYRMRARAPLPREQQESFVALPRMSPLCAELDPRAEAPGGQVLQPEAASPSPEATPTPPGDR